MYVRGRTSHQVTHQSMRCTCSLFVCCQLCFSLFCLSFQTWICVFLLNCSCVCVFSSYNLHFQMYIFKNFICACLYWALCNHSRYNIKASDASTRHIVFIFVLNFKLGKFIPEENCIFSPPVQFVTIFLRILHLRTWNAYFGIGR